MSLSKQHLSTHTSPIHLDVKVLGDALERQCPEISFALLMGSACKGTVAVGSDIDIAVHISDKSNSVKVYSEIIRIVESLAPGVHCDVGCLNRAEPIYRFEALKGCLLFARDRDEYLEFYSLVSREYESALFHYEKQHVYRVQAREAMTT